MILPVSGRCRHDVGDYVDLADGLESDLVDLGEIGLDNLPHLDSSVLERALRRVRDDAARPQDALAGFNSAL